MEFSDKDVKRMIVLALIAALGILVFFIIRPIILSIFGGLILAYIFYPINRKVYSITGMRNLSASIVTILVLIIVIVPVWFLTPIIVQQIFSLFSLFQALEITKIFQIIFPNASAQFVTQVSLTADTFVTKATSGILNYFLDFLLDFPIILLQGFLVGLVFFFSLRDGDKFQQFVSEISPLNKSHEKVLVEQFKNLTDSLIYGHIITGLIQGLVAGVGFYIFGIKNALVLTLLAIILSIIPLVGPAIIWIPLSVYLFTTGNTNIALAFLAYNAIIVSTIDNIIKPYIVAKRSSESLIAIFIGMIGGLLVFGILGLVIGPLVITYFITLLKAYKDKTLGSLFQS